MGRGHCGRGGGGAPRWSDEGVFFVFIIQEVIVVPLVVPATAAVVVVVAGDTWGAGGAVGKGRLGRPLAQRVETLVVIPATHSEQKLL